MMRKLMQTISTAALVAALSLTAVTALAATPQGQEGMAYREAQDAANGRGTEGMAYRERQDAAKAAKGTEGMAYREDQGPQNDVLVPCNPDGTTAMGHEGMAIREHPMYGRFPFDTLSKITGRSYNDLYAQAYKEHLCSAALAKKLGVFDEYRAARRTAYKVSYRPLVKRHEMSYFQLERLMHKADLRISKLQAEQIDWVKPDNNAMKPVVNKNA
jgi:hypothetical protein